MKLWSCNLHSVIVAGSEFTKLKWVFCFCKQMILWKTAAPTKDEFKVQSLEFFTTLEVDTSKSYKEEVQEETSS